VFSLICESRKIEDMEVEGELLRRTKEVRRRERGMVE
jgi:hypothetical protein